MVSTLSFGNPCKPSGGVQSSLDLSIKRNSGLLPMSTAGVEVGAAPGLLGMRPKLLEVLNAVLAIILLVHHLGGGIGMDDCGKEDNQ